MKNEIIIKEIMEIKEIIIQSLFFQTNNELK